MVDKRKTLEEVEKTLHAFDNDTPLEANPFLVTRIQQLREKRRRTRPAGLRPHISFNQALVIGVLIINIVTVIHYLDWNKNHNLQDKLVLALKQDFQIDQSQDPF
jgi:hypothetical protein